MTIEERAKKVDKRIKQYEHLAFKADGSYEFGYMVGATEQNAIDIDKACEWLKDALCAGELVIEAFRKYMEEQI